MYIAKIHYTARSSLLHDICDRANFAPLISCGCAIFIHFIVCDGIVIDTLVEAIKENIANEWKLLGRAMRMSETEIGAIEYDHRLSLREQIFQLFYQWQRKEGEDATSEVVIAALEKAKLTGILEILQDKCIIEEDTGKAMV